MQDTTCATCGTPLPTTAWAYTICADSCLDAFIDTHITPRAPAFVDASQDAAHA